MSWQKLAPSALVFLLALLNTNCGVSSSAAPPASVQLNVQMAGTGTGTVNSSPAGISCGSACTAAFDSGTEVTLTAAPAQGSTFAGWTGACSGTSTCKVTLTSNQSVTATFSVGSG